MLKKILIAEDDVAIGSALKLKLENSSFNVTLVNNGKKALDIIKEKGNFDLILIDLIMPELNGFQLMEELHKLGNKIPMIVLSNLGQEEDVQKSKNLGAVDYFIKSDIELAEIIKKINELLKK